MVQHSGITGDRDAMTENSRTAAVIKGQISKFSGIISRELPKPKQRLVREMIYGIQAAKDIKLSNITRSLNEPLALIKTEDRLSRNLDDRDFTDEINKEICRLASRKVLDDMVIAIDGGITEENAQEVVSAGADALIAGTAFFKAADPAQTAAKIRAMTR